MDAHTKRTNAARRNSIPATGKCHLDPRQNTGTTTTAPTAANEPVISQFRKPPRTYLYHISVLPENAKEALRLSMVSKAMETIAALAANLTRHFRSLSFTRSLNTATNSKLFLKAEFPRQQNSENNQGRTAARHSALPRRTVRRAAD